MGGLLILGLVSMVAAQNSSEQSNQDIEQALAKRRAEVQADDLKNREVFGRSKPFTRSRISGGGKILDLNQ